MSRSLSSEVQSYTLAHASCMDTYTHVDTCIRVDVLYVYTRTRMLIELCKNTSTTEVRDFLFLKNSYQACEVPGRRGIDFSIHSNQVHTDTCMQIRPHVYIIYLRRKAYIHIHVGAHVYISVSVYMYLGTYISVNVVCSLCSSADILWFVNKLWLEGSLLTSEVSLHPIRFVFFSFCPAVNLPLPVFVCFLRFHGGRVYEC